jgi:hypothetical protein
MTGSSSRLLLLALAATSFVTSACASASPRVTVLGVEPSRASLAAPRSSLLVFVEVVNPTGRDLRLSRLEYRVRADSWFESEGQVRLAREIAAGQSAVVEIPVPLRGAGTAHDGAIPYSLEGKLFALDDNIERSWRVAARGAIGRAGERGSPVRVTVVE